MRTESHVLSLQRLLGVLYAFCFSVVNQIFFFVFIFLPILLPLRSCCRGRPHHSPHILVTPLVPYFYCNALQNTVTDSMVKATRLFTLQVKRYSYSIINGNTTSQPVTRLWSLQRNCTSKCEPGCIVIGERTKLHACTVCCGTYLCNTMDGAPPHRHSTLVTVFYILVLTAFTS